MNFLPALIQQKTLLITFCCVIVILVIGAAFIGPFQQFETFTPKTGFQQKKLPELPIILTAIPVSDTEFLYTVRLAEPLDQPISGLSLRLLSEGGIPTQKINFALAPVLSEAGWQTAISTTSAYDTEVPDAGFVYELALLQLNPEPFILAPEQPFGTFTVQVESSEALPPFTIDSELSSVTAKDGQEWRLVLE